MPIAIGDKVYEDEVHYNAAALGIELPKEDTTSTTPSTPSEKPADALKMQEGIQVPAEVNASPERSILGQLTGSDSQERYQTFPERMVRGAISGAISAMALPGDVLSGKVQPGSTQEIERAMDLAGLMVGGPAPVAAKMADGTLGSFAGVVSKTIDKNRLAEAQIMKANGASADEVWQKTGFFQGADTRWRFEIPDAPAKLKMENFQDVTPKQTYDWTSANTNTGTLIRPKNPLNDTDMSKMSILQQVEHLSNSEVHQPLSEIIDHPELFKAYPFLKDTKVQNMPEAMREKALAYVDSDGTIHMSPMSPDQTKEILMHEVQHIIQSKEGFARGGNPGMFEHPNLSKAQKIYDDAVAQGGDPNSPALTKAKQIIEDNKAKALEDYKRLAGEVESRNVEARMRLAEHLRAKTNPRNTEEYAGHEQIVKFSGKPMAMSVEVKPGQLPDGYFDKVPIETRLSRSGTEPSHPGFRWEVYDPKSGKVMRKDIMSRSGASKTQDNLDNKYGGYKYRVRMVKASSLTDNETKFLKENNINFE